MTHQIIDKHIGVTTKTELLFLVWLYSKWPGGILVRNIDFPIFSKHSTNRYLGRLENQGLIKWKNKGSIYSEVFPCP